MFARENVGFILIYKIYMLIIYDFVYERKRERGREMKG